MRRWTFSSSSTQIKRYCQNQLLLDRPPFPPYFNRPSFPPPSSRTQRGHFPNARPCCPYLATRAAARELDPICSPTSGSPPVAARQTSSTMWGKNRNIINRHAVCALPSKHPKSHRLVAARADTDHTTGVGQVAITGRYDSKNDSFGVDAAYAVDDANTLYASYGVTDERLLAVGLETGFTAFGRRNTIDMVYNPPNDIAVMKVAVRQGRTKLSGIFAFDNFQASNVKNHTEKYELDAKLSGVESLKMSFDSKSKASRVKVSRALDSKNRLDAEYHYLDATSKHVSLTFKHQYSKRHVFAVTTNYGSKKYKVEWDCKTENGPWTLATTFPFNASPHTGDFHIKRRFEF